MVTVLLSGARAGTKAEAAPSASARITAKNRAIVGNLLLIGVQRIFNRVPAKKKKLVGDDKTAVNNMEHARTRAHEFAQ